MQPLPTIPPASPRVAARRSLARTTRRWLALAGSVALVAAVTLALRWSYQASDVFVADDLSNITYGADLLRGGKLPLVDSAETRAPGASFLTWALWSLTERSLVVVHRFAVIWTLLAAVGVLLLGRVLWGTGHGLVAALVYSAGAPALDGLTIGHATFMVTPLIWSAVALAQALRSGRAGWIVASGALLAWAAFTKHPAALLLPVHAAILALGPRLARPPGWAVARRRWLWHLAAGVGLVVLPVALLYTVHGGLWQLVAGYLFNRAGWSFLGGEGSWEVILPRIKDGLNGLWQFAALPTLLGSMGLVGLCLRPRGAWTAPGLLLAGLGLSGLVGGTLGFRFVETHYIQVLPALCLLAGHPDGPLMRWGAPWARATSRVERAVRVGLVGCLVLALVPALLLQGRSIKELRDRAEYPDMDQAALRAVGRTIQANAHPAHPTLWAWGAPARALYYYTAFTAPTRHYDQIGVLTGHPHESWRRSGRLRFRRGPAAGELAADLRRSKPRFIVVSRGIPTHGFRALGRLLREHYQPVQRLTTSRVRVYLRKGVELKTPG